MCDHVPGPPGGFVMRRANNPISCCLVCLVIVGNGGSRDKASERPASYLGFDGHRSLLCVAIVIAAGWLGKSDTRDGEVAHVKERSTTV